MESPVGLQHVMSCECFWFQESLKNEVPTQQDEFESLQPLFISLVEYFGTVTKCMWNFSNDQKVQGIWLRLLHMESICLSSVFTFSLFIFPEIPSK
jgi:hypothetical protein